MRSASGEQDGEGRRSSRAWRVRGLALVVLAVWVGLLFDPVLGPTLLTLLGVFAGVIGLFVLAMGLGWLGFGLFAIGDRLACWVRRASGWPES